MPKISIGIPIHETPKTAFFMARLMQSIQEQTFRDFEVVVSANKPMAENHNEVIKRSKGDIIKIMNMDDYFAHPHALGNIVKSFSGQWLISACLHYSNGSVGYPHLPQWGTEMHRGINTLGGMSTITIRNDDPVLFDETLSWVVDCDYYLRSYRKHGPPQLLNDLGVVVDVGTHRLSSTLSDELKREEVSRLIAKYE